MRNVTVVRPYGHQIRRRVFQLLERAGLGVRHTDIIPKGTSDAAIVDALRARTPDVLLIPFHAHRDEDGSGVNGLDLAERLLDALPNLAAVPILLGAAQTGPPAPPWPRVSGPHIPAAALPAPPPT